jgi:hypothetical protein
MKDSIISSNHHYYVFFFQSTKIKNLSAIPILFDNKLGFEVVKFKKNRELDFIHLQIEINNCYGSPLLLGLNITRKNKSEGNFYCYDLYIGKIEIEGQIYFYICYPYNRLGKYLEKNFHGKSVQTIFYKPGLEKVLEYMQQRSNKGLSRMEKSGFNANIVRYSAKVKDDQSAANKVSIVGENPLKSITYEILKADDRIKIETRTLKLRCKQMDLGELEFSFDRLGNYRFWLKVSEFDSNVPMVPFAFKFLMEVAPLEKSNFISTNTLLEND